MDKIVRKPLKVDFHIHSIYSRYKDEYKKVSSNTIENAGTLIGNLNRCEVNMFAITDHDYFSYELYKKLKEQEGQGSILKVLPGVEFSVGFCDLGEIKQKQVHVIALFDDFDESGVKNIEKVLKENIKNDRIDYGNSDNDFFTEERFISILKKINLDVVLIAHQKESVTSESVRKNDLKSVGEKAFNEFLNSEYFDALEYNSFTNGIFNRLFAKTKNERYDLVKFITGSDCHNWGDYEKITKDNDNFEFSFLKCLPSFKGVVMSLTDYSRVSSKDSLEFNENKAKGIDEIDLSVDGESVKLPLSYGINAIIGNNSIGKSLLIHKITDYYKLIDAKIKTGYNSFLERNKIIVNTKIPLSNIYDFDYQGSIRGKFEDPNDIKCFNDKFPEDPSDLLLKEKIYSLINDLCDKISNKFEYETKLDDIKNNLIELSEYDLKNKSLSISNNIPKTSEIKNEIRNINSILKSINGKISKFQDLDNLINFGIDKDDVKELSDIKYRLETMRNKYNERLKPKKFKSSLIDGVKAGIDSTKDILKQYKQEQENKSDKCKEDLLNLSLLIAELFIKKKAISNFDSNFDEENAQVSINNFSDYKFVKRFAGVKVVSQEFFKSFISDLIDESVLNVVNLKASNLYKILKKNKIYDDSKSIVNNLKNILLTQANLLFKVDNVILDKKQDNYDGKSFGANSTIYFDILSSDNSGGIYFVDQPEDDVSQLAVSEKILKYFKKISSHKQIILVTHNPQFVVNLDVDNVICIDRDEAGKINFKSGALEYMSKEYNVLDLVAQHLDGGAETIRKRWKRYDK